MQLPHPGIGLRDRALRLDDGGFQLAWFKGDQWLALLDCLALVDQDISDRARDLASDIDAVGRFHIAARHHRLHEISPHHGIDDDFGADQPARRSQGERDD